MMEETVNEKRRVLRVQGKEREHEMQAKNCNGKEESVNICDEKHVHTFHVGE